MVLLGDVFVTLCDGECVGILLAVIEVCATNGARGLLIVWPVVDDLWAAFG